MRLGVRRVILATLTLGVGGALIGVVAVDRALNGGWPFPPLQRRIRQQPIEGHGTLIIEGVEDRGWLSDGFRWSAAVQAAPGTPPVTFAFWTGREELTPALHTDGGVLVWIDPNQHDLRFRTRDGQWRRLDLTLPGRQFPPPVASPDRLPLEDQARFAADLEGDEAAYAPRTVIRHYDVATHTVVADVYTSRRRALTVHIAPGTLRASLRAVQRLE